MSDIRVASRYAKSLLDLADEKGVLENVHQDMRLFAKTIAENRELKLLLKNPIVKPEKKLAIFNSLFKSHFNEMTMAFFSIVSRKNREGVLDAVATEFEKQYNLKKGIQVASIITATPLTPEMRADFQQMVANQTGNLVQLKEKVDPSILGGFVLRVGDKQIDSSIQNSIRKLKNKLKDNSYITKL